MKTLVEAKPLDQNAENWKRENRLFTSTVLEAGASGAKSNRYARTQKSSNSLIRFRCSNSCFLLETGIAVHERLFLAKWHPKPRKNCQNGVFSTPLTGMKSCTVDGGCTPAPKDATKLAVFFRFFRVFPSTFNKRQRAEVIFRLSRPVSCKNQENGSGKQWSLHAPLLTHVCGLKKKPYESWKKKKNVLLTYIRNKQILNWTLTIKIKVWFICYFRHFGRTA